VLEISPRVAGVSDSVKDNLEVNLPQKIGKVSFQISELFQNFKNNIYLAMSDVKDVFERGFEKGIILCKTTLTIQSNGVSQTPSVGDFRHSVSGVTTEQNQISENQNQEAIQKSSEELSESANDKMREVLIVAPDPESEEEKEKLKEKIELGFSDEVKVRPENENSGIITPVFREGEENDYFYLLIPMREER